MIRADYQEYLRDLKKNLNIYHLDYEKISEEALNAQLQLGNGWMLELDCERFGSGVTVLIKPKYGERAEGYAVWLMMMAIESLTGRSYGKPTVENQIRFLAKEGEDLLRNLPMYEIAYSKVNDFPS
jgi:hypothetical protein